MDYELIYDTATMSTAPVSCLKWAITSLALGAVWTAKLRWFGDSVHLGAKFFLGVGLLLLVMSGLFALEKRQASRRTDLENVEGVIVGHWTKTVRTRRTNSSSYDSVQWEGFSLNGIAFAYSTNTGPNFFNNSGPNQLELRDGVYLRLRYYTESPGPDAVRIIVRVERVLPGRSAPAGAGEASPTSAPAERPRG